MISSKFQTVVKFVLAIVILSFSFGCGTKDAHKHEYTAVAAKQATCTEVGNVLYYECSCGKFFVKNGENYEEKNYDDLILPATGHVFDKEIADEKFLAAEATETTARTYYKSCRCGAFDDENSALTFTVGKTLSDYEKYDKSFYTPVSLTLSLYDAENCVYGFTWNTKAEPARPIVRMCKGNAYGEYVKYGARYEIAESYEIGDKKINYYVCKVEIPLKSDTEYTYTVGDEYMGTTTEAATVKTVVPTEKRRWRFSHVSDSQAEGDVTSGGVDTGNAFAKVLKNVTGKYNNRFMIHTGDVVEYGKYESYWTEMLDKNFNYLSRLPIMAISGNHETTYKNGAYETYKHFDYKMPEQYTDLGFYYSFSYGGVKFIMLNTNRLFADNKLSTDQYEWLENELKTKTEKWTVVCMHNPMYSVGKWGSDPTRNAISRALTAQLGGLFAEYKVDLVLQGHDHMVSRTHPIGTDGKPAEEKKETSGGVEYTLNPDGVIYVMNGPAGDQKKDKSSIYPHDESLYEYAETSEESSWAEFEVSADSITVYVRNAGSGAVKTTHVWGIKKTF